MSDELLHKIHTLVVKNTADTEHIREGLDTLNGTVKEHEKRLRNLEILEGKWAGKVIGVTAAISVGFSALIMFFKTKFLGG